MARAALAEAVGTFVLILLGCNAVHAAVLTGAQSGLWQIAIVWGIAIAAAATVVESISGAHLNPAITLALAAWGRFGWQRVVPYVLAQTAGAFLAAATLYAVFSPHLARREADRHVVRGQPGSELTAMCYGMDFPDAGGLSKADGAYNPEAHARLRALVPVRSAFVAEVFGTAVLALVVFALGDPRNPPRPRGLGPLLVGLTVAALISVIAPLTQAGFNPARDLGPRAFASLAGWGRVAIPGPRGGVAFLVVYTVAPILGALVGGGINTLLQVGRPPCDT
jgi:glycerol uptake facilitator protein